MDRPRRAEILVLHHPNKRDIPDRIDPKPSARANWTGVVFLSISSRVLLVSAPTRQALQIWKNWKRIAAGQAARPYQCDRDRD
jgi:hypothetical protein